MIKQLKRRDWLRLSVVGLIVLIGLTCYWLWHSWQRSEIAPVTRPHLQQIAVTKTLPTSWHMFGIDPDRALPTTQLDLTLQGVFIAGAASQSQALIAAAGGGAAKLYGVGDTTPGGGIIEHIQIDKVILRHNGKLETLPLLLPQLQFAPAPQDFTN